MAAKAIQEVFARIEEEVESQEGLVEELALDSIHFQKFTPEITSKIEEYNKILFLSLNDCALNSLDNFPKLPKLIRLELTENKLYPKELAKLINFKELQSLSLGGNPINTFEELHILKKLNKLIQLDLFGCPISNDPNYRDQIFKIFPSLQILDEKDKDGFEADYYEEDSEDDEDGEQDLSEKFENNDEIQQEERDDDDDNGDEEEEEDEEEEDDDEDDDDDDEGTV